MQTLLIAHRGDTINHKQNTMDAFRSAFTHGANGIELDIHLVNSELLVVHDYLFDRSQKYPILRDVLREFASKGRIEIELKVFTDELVPALKKLLDQYPKLDYELTSSNLFILPKVRQVIADASLGAIFLPKEFEEWMSEEFLVRKIIETCKTLDANVAHIPASILTQNLVQSIHKQNLNIHSHIYLSSAGIYEEVTDYNRLCDMRVDQCTFDNINILAELT